MTSLARRIATLERKHNNMADLNASAVSRLATEVARLMVRVEKLEHPNGPEDVVKSSTEAMDDTVTRNIRTSHAGQNRPTRFGRLLLNWRQRNDVSQQELAEMVDVSRETISHLETGKITMPEWEQLHKIIHSLKIPGTVILRSLDLMLDDREMKLSDLEGGLSSWEQEPDRPRKRPYHRRSSDSRPAEQ